MIPFDQRLAAFIQLGKAFGTFSAHPSWPGHACGLNEEEYASFEAAIHRAGQVNGWFTEGNVRHMLGSLAMMLDAEQLATWMERYPAQSARTQRTVGLIMAGNIPMVGFHDLLCTLLSGHRARIKLSSQDNVLIPAVIELLDRFSPGMRDEAVIDQGKLGKVDAVIATGSNNTARYFEHYFGHLPRIIRKGRVSVAVLDGTESEEGSGQLGEDIFRYFGLGCRNVSKLFVPRDFDPARLFRAIEPWAALIHHQKYANNYGYHRSIWLLDRVNFLDNGFLLLKEDGSIASPVATLFFEHYDDRSLLTTDLESRKDTIQCIVGGGGGIVPFGRSQFPEVSDYADGVDTMKFLLGLGQGANS